MYLIELDTEQAIMAVIAVEASNALLKARLHRADPEGIISASARLQDSKINQLRHQIALGPLAAWDDLADDAQEQFCKLLNAACDSNDPLTDAAVYEALKGFVIGQRVPPKEPLLDV